MKKSKANNHQQASKELAVLDAKLAETLQEEINESDKGHYNVILVRIKDRPGEAKNEVTMNIQTFNKRGFERLGDNLAFHGINKMILLHDPALETEEDEVIIPNHEIQKTEEEIRKEVEEGNDEKVKALVDEALKKAMGEQTEVPNHLKQKMESDIKAEVTKGNEAEIERRVQEALAEKKSLEQSNGEGGQDGPKPEDFVKDMTIDQMKEFAKANNVDITGLKKAEEFKIRIVEFLNESK